MATTSAEILPLLGAGTPPRVNPTQVAKDVYLLRPEKEGLGSSSDPKVIILCGWMDAKLRSLLTYMTKYNALFPGATQVLVLRRQSTQWTSQSKNLDAIRPAAEILKGLGLLGPSPPNVLVHAFSNGGGQQLLLLSELLRQVSQPPETATTVPANCLILDSLPGNVDLLSALRAFTATIKWLPFKLLAMVPLTILWCLIMGTCFILRRRDPIEVLRRGLNEPNVLPWTTVKTPRVYIYSKEDLMVPSTAVESHIAIAKADKGFPVTAELFHRSPHVAHSRTDPDRYWTIVRDIWVEAVNTKTPPATIVL